MMVNRDPNHYAKGLAKHVTNLCHEHPALNIVMASLKAHFLVGLYFPSPILMLHNPSPSCSHPNPQCPFHAHRYQKIQEEQAGFHHTHEGLHPTHHGPAPSLVQPQHAAPQATKGTHLHPHTLILAPTNICFFILVFIILKYGLHLV
jgi:hypothetical protein